MLLDASQSQLVLVDYQARLMPAIFEAEAVARNAVRLGQLAKLMKVPAFATEENPSGLGPNLPDITALVQRTLSKMQFSAVEEGLAEWLRAPAPAAPRGNARSLPKHLQKPAPEQQERNQIVIAGCETHVCLLQTALDLIEDEFEVWVVTDACSSRTERNRDAAFDRLAGAGAELVTTEMVAFEWLRGSEHPAFREALALVR
ncbi:MAG TPA: isochorismatase family protein [Variovorax sp.]|nr:isochorismatase family protein [Variovorax sp.]